jgi:hypothetical protein
VRGGAEPPPMTLSGLLRSSMGIRLIQRRPTCRAVTLGVLIHIQEGRASDPDLEYCLGWYQGK